MEFPKKSIWTPWLRWIYAKRVYAMNVGKSVKVSQIHQHLAHMLIEINHTGWYCKRLWVSVIYYYLTCSIISFFYYHGLGQYMCFVMQQFSRFCFLKNWGSSCDQSCVAGFIVYERLHHFCQSHHCPYRHILFKPDSYYSHDTLNETIRIWENVISAVSSN
jgi:hypothetical protein